MYERNVCESPMNESMHNMETVLIHFKKYVEKEDTEEGKCMVNDEVINSRERANLKMLEVCVCSV